MRWTLRFLLLAILLFVLATVLLIKSVEVWDQYNVPAYIWASLNTKFRHEAPAVRPSDGPGDKVVVMAKTEAQNTDWVAEHLPEYFPYAIL